MLHVYYGTDRQKVRDAAANFVSYQISKEANADYGNGSAQVVKNLPPNTVLTVIDSTDYQSGQITNALGAASLFGGAECYVLDSPSLNTEMEEEVLDNLAAMGESPNTFIVLEGALLAPVKKKYAKYAFSEPQEFNTEKTERFNTFAMADALASKDRRQLWVLLQQAKLAGLAAEEIIGVLWWQLKTLRLAEMTSSASEAGIKDFPYNKAKRSLVKFQTGEVEQLLYSLLKLYHGGHAGLCDIDLALERWVLGGK